jgi:hypothetical protein
VAPTAPTIALTAPASPLTAPATIALSATTTGPLTQVEFYNGTTLLFTDTTAPYAFTWSNVPAGSYTVTAKAIATNGLTATSAPATLTVGTAPSGPTLAAHWPFDAASGNSTPDATPNNNPITLSGNFALVPGTIGQAIQFDRNTGAGNSQRSVLDPTKSYTISLWVNLSNTAGTQTFVSLPGNQVSNFYLQLAGWLHGGFALDVYSADSTSAPESIAQSSTIPVANRWYHLVAVHDAEAKRLRLYVDGQRESEVDAAIGTFPSNRPLAFGYSIYEGTRFDGNDAKLDDIKVFLNALSDSEVADLAISNPTPPAPPTIALSAPVTPLAAPATVTLAATTTGTLTQVEFYNGTTLLFTDTTAPYAYTWSNVAAGSYTLTAKAIATNGLSATSTPATVTVGAVPTILLSAPTATLNAPATVPLSATTTGTLTQVEFYNGTTLLFTDTTAPYAYTWSNVPAGSYSITAKAIATNGLSATSAPATVTVGAAPTISLSAPTATLSDPATVSLSATTTGTLTQVEFYNGTTLLFTDTTAPYAYTWSNVAAGSYTVTAKAIATNGLSATSAPATVTVGAAPTISLSAPTATLNAPATVSLSATTTGALTQVEFYNGTTLLFTDTTAPYAYTWSNVPAGAYTITAKAIATNGLSATSTPATVTVGTAPTVSISAPTAPLAAPATVELSAAATGTLTQVEFYNGTTLLFTDTTAPYAFTWSNVPAGSYTVTAKAIASNGLSATSTPATVTVGAPPTVSISAPTTPLAAPASISLSATTTGTLTQVEFYNETTLLFTDTTAPYAYTWSNVPAGSYTVTAKAIATNGLSATSTPATVTVGAAPTISLSAPTATLNAPATVALSATTTGTLTQVEFYNGTTLLFTDTTAPYAYTWSNVPAGSYTVTAKAIATNGLSATSTPATVTVGTAPTVSISAPTAPLAAPATMELSATTTGTLTQVEFYNGTTLLFTDTTAPYAYTWSNVPAGSYTVTARAIATNGLSATSTPATVTVGAAPAISLSAPATPLAAPASISLSATTTGTLTQVEFYNGTTLLFTDTTAPYAYTWSNVPAGSYTITARAIATNGLSATSTPATVTVGAAPTISISAPTATLSAPASVSLSATTTGTLTQVEFYNGTTLLFTDTTAPYAYTWPNVPAGSYTLTAKAIATNGLSATSTPATVTVGAAPTISLSAPTATLNAPATVSLSATTSGTLTQVEFYNGTTLLFTDTTAPYAYTWPNVPAGSYTLTARATATNGLSATSTPATVTVAVAPTAPTIALTAPTSPLTAPATIALAATTTGALTQVEFYNGTTLLFTDTTAPYAYTWSNVPAGSYTVTAKAVATNGLSATSAPATLTVGGAPTGPTLAGHWRFDTVAAAATPDTTPNNNPINLSGNFALVPGTIGQAIQFDPNTGAGNSQRSVLDPTKSYTISLWVNLSNTAGTQTFVSLPGNQVSNFYLQLAGWLHGGFALDVYSADSTSAPEAIAQSSTIPVANRWYHLVAVHDAQAKRLRLYVDGQPESDVSAAVGTFPNTRPLAVGYSIYDGTRYDGNNAKLDDLKVFPNALSAAEVLTLFGTR